MENVPFGRSVPSNIGDATAHRYSISGRIAIHKVSITQNDHVRRSLLSVRRRQIFGQQFFPFRLFFVVHSKCVEFNDDWWEINNEHVKMQRQMWRKKVKRKSRNRDVTYYYYYFYYIGKNAFSTTDDDVDAK